MSKSDDPRVLIVAGSLGPFALLLGVLPLM